MTMKRIAASAKLISVPLLFCTGFAAAPALAGDAAAWTLQEALGNPDNLKISGGMRVRYEALDNQFRPGLDRKDDIVVLRTNLFAEYDTGPVRVGAELVDARAYDTDAGSSVGTSDVNALELTQAYVGFDFGSAFGKGSDATLDAGRFTMDLGSRRLWARNNYRNTINAFTGFRAQYRGPGKTSVTLFYTLPNTRLPADKPSILDNKVEWDRQSFDLTFWGAFFSKALPGGGPTVEAYFYGLNEKDSPGTATRNRNLYTPGIRIYRKPKARQFDYELEGIYQFGTIRSSTAASAPELDVSAYFLHGELGYRFAGGWEPRLVAVYDRASGDKAGGKYNRFDTLYGARRGEFGPTGIYGLLGRANISSPGVKLEVKPDKRWDGFVMYRAAWLDSATDSFASTSVRDATGASGKFTGQQVEARVRYWIVPKLLRLETGGAVFFNGRFLDNAPNANGNGNPTYGYFALEATF